ncbi:MAG TPA: hypothetical protein VHE83_07595 [Mycobacteriales bacterium]|nr:hypothetical protein [Mycobacteriales bacterium]
MSAPRLDDAALAAAVRSAVGRRVDVDDRQLDGADLWQRGRVARRRARRTTVLTTGVVLAAAATGLAIALVGPGDRHANHPVAPRPSASTEVLSPKPPTPQSAALAAAYAPAIRAAVAPYHFGHLNVVGVPADDMSDYAAGVAVAYATGGPDVRPASATPADARPGYLPSWQLEIVQHTVSHDAMTDLRARFANGPSVPSLTSGHFDDGSSWAAVTSGSLVVVVRTDGVELIESVGYLQDAKGRVSAAQDVSGGHGLDIARAIVTAAPLQHRLLTPGQLTWSAGPTPPAIAALAAAARQAPDVAAHAAVLYVQSEHVDRQHRPFPSGREAWIRSDGGNSFFHNGSLPFGAVRLEGHGTTQPKRPFPLGSQLLDWNGVRALPSNPSQLRSVIDRALVEAPEQTTRPSGRLQQIANLLIESPASPQVQAALAAVAAQIPGAAVTTDEPTGLPGVRGTAVTVGGLRIIWDPATGTMVEIDNLTGLGASMAGGTLYAVTAAVDRLKDRPAPGAVTLP